MLPLIDFSNKKAVFMRLLAFLQTPRKEDYMKRIVTYAMSVNLAFRKRLVNVKEREEEI